MKTVKATDKNIAKRLVEISIPPSIMESQQKCPKLNFLIGEWFDGRAIMVWNSRTRELRFLKVKP